MSGTEELVDDSCCALDRPTSGNDALCQLDDELGNLIDADICSGSWETSGIGHRSVV